MLLNRIFFLCYLCRMWNSSYLFNKWINWI